MTVMEPLALAIARAASRAVGESKVGKRKGSVTAVALAMSERGVAISHNQLSRKLAGSYPLNTDELVALCAVIGVEPDAVWREALRDVAQPSTLSGYVQTQVSPEAAAGIAAGLAAVEDERASGN